MRSYLKEANNMPRDGFFIRPMLSSFTQIFHIFIREAAMQLFDRGPHPHNSKQQPSLNAKKVTSNSISRSEAIYPEGQKPT
jgi:hypothetical protein